MFLHRLIVVVETADWKVSRLASWICDDDTFASATMRHSNFHLFLCIRNQLFVRIGPTFDHAASSAIEIHHLNFH